MHPEASYLNNSEKQIWCGVCIWIGVFVLCECFPWKYVSPLLPTSWWSIIGISPIGKSAMCKEPQGWQYTLSYCWIHISYIYISFMWVVSLVNIFLWAQGIYCQLEVDQALLGSSPPSKPQLGALALLAGWYWHSSSSCREVGCGCWSSQYPVWFSATQDVGNCCAEPRHLDYHYNI